MPSISAVAGFSYEVSTIDGCQCVRRFAISEGKPKELPNQGWLPMTPKADPDCARLTTHYRDGRALVIELDGPEHTALAGNGGFEKMLSSIALGNMPGEALKRQITKAFDLPKLPKIKRAKMR